MDPGGMRFGALLDAVDQERSRLGRKLHDTVVQNLAAISIQLCLLENACEAAESRETIHQCTGLIDQSIKELRAISSYLSPVVLHELDFAACLRGIAEFAAADGIPVQLDVKAVRRVELSRPTRDGLFRLIWDAVRAIAQAGAPEIQVSVTAVRELLCIRLAGEVPSKTPDSGGNLLWWIVQERAGRLGGRVKIDQSAGPWEVEFTIPHGG